MKKILTALLLVVFLSTSLDAQNFESYKKMQQKAFQAHKKSFKRTGMLIGVKQMLTLRSI